MLFQFDDSKDFAKNLDDFLSHMETEDPQMAEIFRANVPSLLSATDDSERRGARALFGLGVVSALDEIWGRAPEDTED